MGWTRAFAVACLVGMATIASVDLPAAAAISAPTGPSLSGALPSGASASGASATTDRLSLKPASGQPNTLVVVTPVFGQATRCELDWDGSVLEPAFACGETGGGFLTTSLRVPDKPGAHRITACWPTCARPVQAQDGIFTVTDPTAPDTASVAPAGGPSLSVSIPDSVLKTLSRTTPSARPVVVSMTVTPLARPAAGRGTPPFALIGAVIALLVLVSLGGGLFLHRRPRGRHAPVQGPVVVVTTYARTRTVHTSRPRLDSPHVGVTTRRGRLTQVRHVRRRQEYRS